MNTSKTLMIAGGALALSSVVINNMNPIAEREKSTNPIVHNSHYIMFGGLALAAVGLFLHMKKTS